MARRETGERKARNHVCHAIGEGVLDAYGGKWQTLDPARLGDLIRTEIPARGDELTAAGGRATTEDALGRMRAYERGHAQTTEAPAATGSASVIDTNGWE